MSLQFLSYCDLNSLDMNYAQLMCLSTLKGHSKQGPSINLFLNTFFLVFFSPTPPTSSWPIVIHQATVFRGNAKWVSDDKSLIHQTASTPTSRLTQLLFGITNSWGVGGRGGSNERTSIQLTHSPQASLGQTVQPLIDSLTYLLCSKKDVGFAWYESDCMWFCCGFHLCPPASPSR